MSYPFLLARKLGFRENSVAGFCAEMFFPLHPRKLTCPLKRDYFNRKYIFQPLIFRGHSFAFQGMYHLFLRCHRFLSLTTSCYLLMKFMGSIKNRSLEFLVAIFTCTWDPKKSTVTTPPESFWKRLAPVWKISQKIQTFLIGFFGTLFLEAKYETFQKVPTHLNQSQWNSGAFAVSFREGVYC